ncbi:HAMP domain-containing sensor histidine kinase [Sphingomonas sp.]|uniref:HAMP domain-containing sensor histidine kinase n=1 Tax=Sphingomonas sp. TaxID=28214 RepID=UPI00286C2F0B|nr:HAMP domain-containing sensor histidine kinase [Sphingomonas sp.]
MTRLRHSAAYRIAFAYSAAIAIGIALLGTVIFWAMHIAFTRQIDALVTDEAQTLLYEYRPNEPAELADAITQRERLSAGAKLYYAVFEPDGRRAMGSLNAAMPELGMHDIPFVDGSGGTDSARGLVIELPDHRRLVVAADREWIERIDQTVLGTFAIGFVILIGFGLGGALLLGGYLQRRLRAIGNAADGIIGGDIRRRMPISDRDDEFDQLARVLNTMLEEIERLLENLRQISSDVAHDLRSPLTHLRNALEESALGGGDAPTRDLVIADAIARVDDILSLFAAILRISEVESGKIRRLFKPVDLSELVTDLAESYAPAVREAGRSLSWSIAPGLAVNGDRELIAQAVTNLLENAQRHTPPDTEIHVRLAASAKWISVAVVDTGPGVAPADRERITRRFIRLESSRTKVGHGLGLNLVSAVARLHRGQLRFADNGPGLVAEIDLPVDPALRPD